MKELRIILVTAGLAGFVSQAFTPQALTSRNSGLQFFSTSPFSSTTSYYRQSYASTRQSVSLKDEETTTTLESTDTKTTTTPDEAVQAPASMVFYDDLLDPSNPAGVVCARGVCVLPEFADELELDEDDASAEISKKKNFVESFLSSYLGPRFLLVLASLLYGTNFPLGAIMNEAMPPAAATSARMVMASLALSPFLFKLDPRLTKSALLCGCFTSIGYITQSIALVDTSPATVAFLGAATVIVTPTVDHFVNKTPMSIRERPQTWLAATLCLIGVGILELYDPTGSSDLFSQVGVGDLWAFGQAVGFGTAFLITERMMAKNPGQALPITATQVSVTAFTSMLWCLADGWIGSPGSESYALPAMLFDPSLQTAAIAVAWTGVITTAFNRVLETSGLGRMTSAEASVILATEPLFAALFAALILSEDFGLNDYVGGFFIVLACLATALKKENFSFFFGTGEENESPAKV